MAEFQQKVAAAPVEGLPGQAIDGYFVPTALGYLSDGTLEAGGFAFSNKNENDAVPFAKKKVAGGTVLGVVMRTNVGMIESPFTAASNVYSKGTPVSIAARGRFYFQVPSGQTPTVGQHACVDPSTGAVTFAEAGQANDTGWAVIRLAQGKTTAAENDIIIIENLG